ncbi:MAG: hypothetical protein JW993_21355 [Sedimentisphaerales bacterium]|nr:hypothetical protein [Sedimentisphaerales bacterium]
MKLIGFAMVTVGFIVAALASVVDPGGIDETPTAPPVEERTTEDANSATPIEESAVAGPGSVTPREGAVKWLWYVPALALGVAGVVVIRMDIARHSKTEHHVAANIETVEGSLERIASNIEKLDAGKHALDTYDVRHRIDELFTDDLEQFVDARESIAHRHGLAAYAEVMTTFAAGERYLNRVWSASADGYIDEVNEYLEKAKTQFAETLTLLRRLQSSPAV